ncbi:MAG: right-handed parallel beta-helix repeat-containing protein [Ruminococcus sp.]|jgi:hypothetical protein
MIYYVSARAGRCGRGTRENPFQTISEAAALAHPGDEIIVGPGIYREHVNPPRGGSGEDSRIVYRSEKPLEAVITGAEPVKTWTHYKDNVWMTRIPNGVFGDYNPYTTKITGDWYYALEPVHTGDVYLNGQSMYEVMSLDKVLHPVINQSSWDPDFTVYTWYTIQDRDVTVIYANFQGMDPNREIVEINVRRNCFYPARTGINYITLSGFTVKQAATTWAPPTAYQEGMIGPHWSKGWIIEDCEVSHSRCCGISLGKYLQPNNDNKWSVHCLKDGTQTKREIICQAQTEGWCRETIGSHIIRRCDIHDCGQTGIVGHLGCVFSIIEDNHIHHINNKQDLAGAEIGGIKLHAAIDVIIRRNHIHHCTRGVWLDWQVQGTRVSQNLFHHNVPPVGTKIADGLALAEDLFVEVSHGPTLIDNNLLLSDCACRLSAQGLALVHNLIAGSFTWVGQGTDNGSQTLPSPRYTPYHMPHRTEIAGFMTILHGDARFYNNIFVQKEIRRDLVDFAEKDGSYALNKCQFLCGTKPYDGYPSPGEYFRKFRPETTCDGNNKDIYYEHLPVYTGGNVFFNGALPCDTEENFRLDQEHTVNLSIEQRNGSWYLSTDLYEYMPALETPFVSTEMLGEAFEPEQKFEAPDGSPIVFWQDYFGKHREITPLPGPFAAPLGKEQPVFP